MIKKLDWDSVFFNLNIGEITYNQKYEEQNVSEYDLIYVVSKEDFELEINEFENTYSETKVIFIKTLQSNTQNSESIFKFDETNVNLEELYFLAYESGKNSRFLLDTKFNEKHFKKLYQAWIDNSINKKFADDVLVYFDENELKGFITYQVIDKTASVGLVAVNPNFQGMGFGAKLLSYLENLVLKKGAEILTIPTQLQNSSACNFYKKQGYSIESKTFIKHYWKK